MLFLYSIFVEDMLVLNFYCQINEDFHVYKCNVKNVLEWVRVESSCENTNFFSWPINNNPLLKMTILLKSALKWDKKYKKFPLLVPFYVKNCHSYITCYAFFGNHSIYRQIMTRQCHNIMHNVCGFIQTRTPQ